MGNAEIITRIIKINIIFNLFKLICVAFINHINAIKIDPIQVILNTFVHHQSKMSLNSPLVEKMI